MGNKGKVCWGKLYYSDKRGQFRLEFDPNIDYKKHHPPAYVSEFVKSQGYSIKGYFANCWAEDRVIPPDRQNIESILRAHGLKVYRVIDMLEMCMGRCTFDDLYLERIR